MSALIRSRILFSVRCASTRACTGDILLLNMEPGPLKNGDIVVFNIDGRNIPIVHRILRTHDLSTAPESYSEDAVTRLDDGRLVDVDGNPLQELLTKGDNNRRDDRSLYAKGQDWLHRDHVIGKAVGYIPYVGMATILMNDYPWLKYSSSNLRSELAVDVDCWLRTLHV